MTRKRKERVWHKRKNKMLPSSILKGSDHRTEGASPDAPAADRKQAFLQKLKQEIRKAAGQK